MTDTISARLLKGVQYKQYGDTEIDLCTALKLALFDDHIKDQDAKIKALVEALRRLERICKNGQPDKIADGVKIASDAIALAIAAPTYKSP